MIALDSSALVAIARKEAEREAFTRAIATNQCLVGSPTVLESHMVLLDRMGAEGVAVLDGLLAQPHILLVDFDGQLLPIARTAFERYGKGRHPAALNFGDCMAYAVAKAHDVPLLFKGDDFRHTDLRAAVP